VGNPGLLLSQNRDVYFSVHLDRLIFLSLVELDSSFGWRSFRRVTSIGMPRKWKDGSNS
jgi:hypothetical protein